MIFKKRKNVKKKGKKKKIEMKIFFQLMKMAAVPDKGGDLNFIPVQNNVLGKTIYWEFLEKFISLSLSNTHTLFVKTAVCLYIIR